MNENLKTLDGLRGLSEFYIVSTMLAWCLHNPIIMGWVYIQKNTNGMIKAWFIFLPYFNLASLLIVPIVFSAYYYIERLTINYMKKHK